MQKIQIKNLGPIREFSMDVKDFNLIIGEQATGKSTIAKCIYFFRIIKSMVADYLCQLYDTATYKNKPADKGYNAVLKKELKSIFISLFGFSWDLDEQLYLKYEFAPDIWIDVKLKTGEKKYISVRYSKRLDLELGILEKEALELHSQEINRVSSLSFASKERIRNYEHIRMRINEIFSDDKETYYIPAGRSMITLLTNSRSFIENDNLDLITRQFMQVIDSINGSFDNGIRGVHLRYPDGNRSYDVNQIADMLIRNLKGDYKCISGRPYLIIEDSESKNEKIPINYASSGQQEVLWLLNQLYVLLLRKEKSFVIIEEPEAHLYPELQKKVVDFIAFFTNKTDSSVFVTTHSPYVLTATNNLYCAGKIVDEDNKMAKKVHEILGLPSEILPKEFNAFKIKRDKEVTNLIDGEMGEIITEEIDEISDYISKQYVDLFYLQKSK